MTRLALSLALTLGLLAGCVGQEGNDVAIGEGAVLADSSHGSEGGIGGTGAPARQKTIAGGEESEGGIGGTGIFGTVTAFGSIVVNGLTVEFGETALEEQTSIVGQSPPLAVGSTVLVEAERTDGGWVAVRVSPFLPIVGPVTLIEPASETLSVMGTNILLDDDVIITDRRGYVDGKIVRLDALKPGDRLAVSGLWKGGEVIASRIDRLDDGPDSLRGLLLPSDDGLIVGGTALEQACCDDVTAPAFVDLSGDYHDGRITVDLLGAGPMLLFSGEVNRLVVEAFLARDPDGEGFHLSGFGIPADQSATIAAEPGVRSLFVGAYDDAFLIRRSVPLTGDRSSRSDTLRAIGDITASD